MTASVVTFSVQLGSEGFAVAGAVSQVLGFRYIDRDVISLAASRAGVTAELIASAERWPRLIERLLRSLAGSASPEEDTPAPVLPEGITMRLSSDYRGLVEQVVADLSEQGSCVIVGHSAQVVLKGRADVLKVLIVGSIERRAERLRQEQAISLEQARAAVRDSDRERLQFFKHAYGVNWLDPSLYDLVINTDALDTATAVSMVLRAADGSAAVRT